MTESKRNRWVLRGAVALTVLGLVAVGAAVQLGVWLETEYPAGADQPADLGWPDLPTDPASDAPGDERDLPDNLIVIVDSDGIVFDTRRVRNAALLEAWRLDFGVESNRSPTLLQALKNAPSAPDQASLEALKPLERGYPVIELSGGEIPAAKRTADNRLDLTAVQDELDAIEALRERFRSLPTLSGVTVAAEPDLRFEAVATLMWSLVPVGSMRFDLVRPGSTQQTERVETFPLTGACVRTDAPVAPCAIPHAVVTESGTWFFAADGDQGTICDQMNAGVHINARLAGDAPAPWNGDWRNAPLQGPDKCGFASEHVFEGAARRVSSNPFAGFGAVRVCDVATVAYAPNVSYRRVHAAVEQLAKIPEVRRIALPVSAEIAAATCEVPGRLRQPE